MYRIAPLPSENDPNPGVAQTESTRPKRTLGAPWECGRGAEAGGGLPPQLRAAAVVSVAHKDFYEDFNRNPQLKMLENPGVEK